MNTVTSRQWNTYSVPKQVDLFRENFSSSKFVAQYGHPVSYLPGIHALTMLRAMRIGTLEVLENRQDCTVYRIRQTGTVFCTTAAGDQLYNNYQEYLQNRSDSPILRLFDSKEIVYTLRNEGYQTFIERHKAPRFSGRIDITEQSLLDDSTGKHIDVTDIHWIDTPPATEKEFSTVMKKTILFIRANYAKAQSSGGNTTPKNQTGYVQDGEPKNWPKPFKPSDQEVLMAAKTLAKHISPKYALSEPESGKQLARGQRKSTPDQDIP